MARVQIRALQPTHLGQALVRFRRVYDRDSLIANSPHQFDNVNISFVRHNQGRNWRRVTFNREVWLMLLGFPFDYIEEEYIDNALAPFGKMITWDHNPEFKTRLMVRARVVDLESIPHFIVLSETEGMDSDSWTIQCELVQQELLGAGPPIEDQIPVQAQNFDQMPFAFFGLGQQGPGPVNQPHIQNPLVQQVALEQQNAQGANWDFWPEMLPALGHQVVQDFPINQQVGPNNQPILQDLNEEPILEDPAEVLIHPPPALNQGQQDLDWEHMNDEVEMQIAQPEPPVQHIDIEQQPVQVPEIPANQQNFLHHEIPEDMLMNDLELADLNQAMEEQHDENPIDHLGNNLQVGLIRIIDGPPSSIIPKLYNSRPSLFP